MVALNSIQNPSLYQYQPQTGSATTAAAQDQSIFTNAEATTAAAQPVSSECTDGKDDGKIGFFDAIGSAISGAFNGIVNGIKGCFTDENGNFSLWNTLKTVATVGACFIPGVGPIIGAGLCVSGVVKGAGTIINGIDAASKATTDAEAKAAFEEIGSGTLTTAASAVGLKGSVGAIAKGIRGAKGAVAEELAATEGATAAATEGATAAATEGATAAAAKSGFLSDLKTITAKTGDSGTIVSTLKNLKTSAGFGENGLYSTAFQEGKAAAAEAGKNQFLGGVKTVAGAGARGTAMNIGQAARSIKDKFTSAKDKLTNKANPDVTAETAESTELDVKNTKEPNFAQKQANKFKNKVSEWDEKLSNKSKTYKKASEAAKDLKEFYNAGKTENLNTEGFFDDTEITGGGALSARQAATVGLSEVTKKGSDAAAKKVKNAQYEAQYQNYSPVSSNPTKSPVLNLESYKLPSSEELDAKFGAINNNAAIIRDIAKTGNL